MAIETNLRLTSRATGINRCGLIGGGRRGVKPDGRARARRKSPMLSFHKIIDVAKAKSQQTGRVTSVDPKAKNPTWDDAQAIDNGCGNLRDSL